MINKLTNQQIQKTESKFERWNNRKEEFKVEEDSVILFHDPTIWAYAMLKDATNDPLKLYSYQDLIINDKKSHLAFCTGRQVGKTTMLCVKALHHAIFVDNAFVIIVSRSEPQATHVLDEIKEMMMRSHISFKEIIGDVENRMELHIKISEKSVSKIICMPATERGRGYSPTLLLLDEIGYWEGPNKETDATYLYQSIYEPSISATKDRKHEFLTMGQIVACSSPNGQQGIFWRMWNDDRFGKYHFDWRIKPGRTNEEYEALRRNMVTMRFESEYAAQFVNIEGGFITEHEYANSVKDYKLMIPPNATLFIGGDFAAEDVVSRDTDFTVLYGVIVYREKENEPLIIRLVWQKEYPKKTPKEIVYNDLNHMKNIINKFGYDKVGVGDSVKNDLIDKVILNEFQIEVLTYSLPNKSEVYYNLKHLFEQGRIEISPQAYSQLKDQLCSLQFKLSPSSTSIKVHHKEGFHDDHADAFANACYVALRLGMGEAKIERINIDEPDKRVDRKGRFKVKENYVECDICNEDWEYDNEQSCPYCEASKEHLGWYVTGRRI